MQRTGTNRRRSAFTLIELIVVIGIIVILAGLLLSAITKVRETIPRVRTKDEIGQMSLAVESFKSTYQVQYIPTCLWITNDYSASTASPALLDSRQYVSRVWPKAMFTNPMTGASGQTTWQGDGTLWPAGARPLDGNQVLVFLLGGMGRQGFHQSPNNPFQVPVDGSAAKGPFFNFKLDRIDNDGHYHDFYWDGQNPSSAVYYYFSSFAGSDYDYFGKKYYDRAPDGSQNPDPGRIGGITREGGYGNPNANTLVAPLRGLDGRYLNPNGFQIISAGRDNLPGRGSPCNPAAWTPNNVPWPMRICQQYQLYDPGINDYSPGNVGGDDLSNFARGPLSVGD